MAYILRTHIEKKKLIVGLCLVFGIGHSLSKKICNNLGFQNSFLLKNLTDEDIYLISLFVDDLKILVKGDLNRWLKQKIDYLVSLNTYRGFRHRQGLPLRGQRTHTNARTTKKLRFKKRL
jgi:small subunit ribosomal protein S13